MSERAHSVLIVDDSPFTGDVLARGLRKAGFEVHIARDLWDLERPLPSKPDLVLLDVVLAEAFGDDLAPLLRSTHGYTCPIVLLSSLPDEVLAQRAKEAELEGYIPKHLGLVAIVARVRELLATAAQPAVAADPAAAAFEVTARQRARRAKHVAGDPAHWNATAIIAEMQALAGDAEVVGAAAVAAAANACREAVQKHGSAGWTAEIGAAMRALAQAVGDSAEAVAKLLVIDATAFARETLYAGLDRAGFVVMEAATLAEARQKLFATRYDLVLVDDKLRAEDPALVPELRAALPDVRVDILGVAPLDKKLDGARLVEEIQGLARAHGTGSKR